MQYDFHPDAQKELQIAVDYYDRINPELGDAFLDEVERSLERIVKFPEAWVQLSINTRRCRTVGFPYGIGYQIRSDRRHGSAFFLSRLRYILVDEMHSFNGVYGANMALLLRRLSLRCVC
jgi:plasmid stabilization system protein ParE